jgi:heptosyltransferase-1
MPSILFVKTSSLGDVIHHMPAIADVRRHIPAARISWMVEEAYVPLVGLHGGVDEIIPVATRRWRCHLAETRTWREIRGFCARMRGQRFDAIIDSQGLLRTALMARLASGPHHGFDRSSIREPLASRFYDVRHSIGRDVHVIERNRLLTARALGYVHAGEPEYGLQCSRSVAQRPYAIFFHSTARLDKHWIVERWIALGQALTDRGLDIVLPWGTEEERGRSEAIARDIPSAQIPERLPVVDLCPMIANAALVVGVDTGLMHLAAALQTPLIGIFTGTSAVQARPRGAGPIRVFGGRGEQPEAEEVIDAARQLLG